MRLPVPALLAAAALAAGCGSDSDPPSREEFVAEADAICEKANQSIDRESARVLETSNDPAELAKAIPAITEVREQARRGLADLEAPEDLRPDVRRYLDTLGEAIRNDRESVAVIRERDVVAFGELQSAGARLDAKRERIAERIGFKVCGATAQE
jgi:hypothetical protein